MTSRILVCCLAIAVGTVAVFAAPQQTQEKQQKQTQEQPQQKKSQEQQLPQDQPPSDDYVGGPSYPAPEIHWGKCPQLKPSDKDKEQKRQVIQKCLEQNPPPAYETITDPKQIDDHREIVTTCALKTEGWFNDDGSYKFNRAKTEIESKKLDAEVEKNISKRHEECQDDAVKRYPEGYIQQVQLYQACMDYHIADICEIELIPPPGGFPVDELIDYDDIPIQDVPASAPVSSGEPKEAPAKKEEKKKEN